MHLLLANNSAAGGGGAGAYESIASQTLGSDTATVTFSSIPSTYQHLQLRIMGRHSGSNTSVLGAALRFNSDTSANYIEHILRGNGSSVLSTGNTGRTYSLIDTCIPGNNFTAGIFGVSIIDIHDYAATTKNKTLRSINGIDTNSTAGYLTLNSSLWLNTNAINTILIYPESNNWKAGSTFALYGIKGA